MKISVCGKGGSGKSTVVTLLAQVARDRGYPVLVVDADESNLALCRLLGFPEPPAPIMALLGGKQGVREKMRQPEVFTEDAISTDSIPGEYIRQRDGLRLVSIGKIQESLEGCACPMGVLGREFLGKLVLRPKELVIVDTEAGVEHFGRGMDAGLDGVLIVVEPSFESVELAGRMMRLADGAGVPRSWVVLNKIPTPEVAARLTASLEPQGIKIIGCLPRDAAVFQSGLEGSALSGGRAAEEIKSVLEGILASRGGN